MPQGDGTSTGGTDGHKKKKVERKFHLNEISSKKNQQLIKKGKKEENGSIRSKPNESNILLIYSINTCVHVCIYKFNKVHLKSEK